MGTNLKKTTKTNIQKVSKKVSKTWEAAIKSKGTVIVNDPALFL